MFAAGQSIGNYRVLAQIGTGGMGAVYLAEHPLIGKKVALKVIHRELAGNKEVVQRFFQEARAVNRIGNEHIVEIHDFGMTPEGDHFYIMEYLEGRTLASVLGAERVLDPRRTLHIAAQIASALAAAHASGVIHRDLKPDNIMLLSRHGDPDFVKVLDFGLAKMFASGGTSAVQTAAGVLLGTPQYMSPEACESKRDVDHRTDVYALGILMFQMMTGRLPFDGTSMGEVLVKQVTQLPPAPRGLNAAIPPSVEQLLLRCLAKQADARFQSMAELRGALLDPDAYLRGSPPIAAARSVAPGEAPVDARQVRAAAELRARQQGKTMLDGAFAAPAPGRSATGPVPSLAQPAPMKHDTMRIATPIGYSSRAPRKVWPIVLVVGLLLGLGGGAFAVAWFGKGKRAPAGVEAGLAGSTGVVDAAAAAAPDAAPAPAAAPDAAAAAAPDAAAGTGTGTGDSEAMVAIDSKPEGATVTAPDGRELGKTPLRFAWARSDTPVTFKLQLRGHRSRTVELVVGGNLATTVELARVPAQRPPTRGSAATPPPSRDGLERPD